MAKGKKVHTESVGTRQGHHFLVIEAHTTENGADVVLALGCIREATIGGAI